VSADNAVAGAARPVRDGTGGAGVLSGETGADPGGNTRGPAGAAVRPDPRARPRPAVQQSSPQSPSAKPSPSPPDPGYLPRDPAPDARLRLYCFHHAGGAASAFAGWRTALAPDVSVLPVQLPGREGRVGAGRLTRITQLVEDIDGCIGPAPTEPFAFYGHSMGALLAYALCQRRLRLGRSLPVALLVGAYGPPDQPPDLAPIIGLPDDELVHWLLGLGGMSPALLGYPAWLAAAAALTRDDLRVCHSYQHSAHADAGPLPCPIHVFHGSDDPLSAENEAGWSAHTSAGCATHEVPGGHLFAYGPDFAADCGRPFRAVLTELTAHSGSRPAGSATGGSGTTGLGHLPHQRDHVSL
jgi:surfactin synthase thioesterase subunit